MAILVAFGLSAQVNRGPYLQTGTSSSTIVRWRTSEPVEGVVRYGTDTATMDLAAFEGNVSTEHVVELAGLLADTKYFYSIGTPTATLAEGFDHFFFTSPLPGTPKPVRIWAIGDSGTKNANAQAVRDAYLQWEPGRPTDVWLMLGDNAYPDGTDEEYQEAVFDLYPQLLRNSVLWPTLGNHDGHTADSATQSGPYYEIFSLPRNGEAGGLASGTEAYYSFDYGNVHFICLESYETDRSPSGAMMTWLEADLQLNDKDWIIAYWHHPPYSKGSHDSDTETPLIQMRENALPILEQYGVDLVLSGHSHSYERSYLLDGHYGHSSTLTPDMKLDEGDGKETGDGAYLKPPLTGAAHEGAVYVVAGSSGQLSPGSMDHPAMFISLQSLGSLILDISGNRLDAIFLSENGSTLDTYTVVKGIDDTPPTITSVRAEGDPASVRVRFSKALEQVSATTISNYAIDNSVVVNSAFLESDGRTVVLTTSPLTTGLAYTLTVNNVIDLGGHPIAPNSQQTFEYFNIVTDTFQDGAWPDADYAGTRDTHISENAPSSNFRASLVLRVDGDASGGDLAGLLKWDVSRVPSGARVQSVDITVNVINPSPGPYELYGVKRDWVEAEANWNQYSIGNPWDVAGALGPTDRGSSVLATLSASSVGAKTFSLNADGIGLVQSWVGDPARNFGVIVGNTDTTDGLHFDSREVETIGNRPRLAITYSIAGPNRPPMLSGTPTTSVVEDSPYSFTPTAQDEDGDVLSFMITNRPAWAVFDPTTGALTGTPTRADIGLYDNIIISVTDNVIPAPISLGPFSIDVLAGAPVTESFQDGLSPEPSYLGTRDTSLSQEAPEAAFGLDTVLRLDGDDPPETANDWATLVEWDLSSIPAGSEVVSVDLTIYVSNLSRASFEIYGMERDWMEQEATWNEASSGSPWEVAGAKGPSDRASTVLGILSGSSEGVNSFSLNPEGVALVQSWVDHPEANYGFIVADSSVLNSLELDSRESATPATRPRLTVTYSPRGSRNQAPVAVADAYTADQGATLSVPAASGLSANDTDPENDSLSAVLVSNPSHAAAFVLNADGSFIYTHDGSETTADSFTYKANDGALDSSTVTVSLSIKPLVTESLQDGLSPEPSYLGTRDTSLSQEAPEAAFGLDTVLRLDGDDPPETANDWATLVEWDLSSIPAGSEVVSVDLTIYVSNLSRASFEIYGMERDWMEQEATWNEASSGSPWEVAGAKGPSDRASTVLGILSGSSEGVNSFSLNPEGVALVQSWVDHPEANYGFIVADSSVLNSLELDSRESAAPATRPRLTVTYFPR